jgi:hypothetical protein
MGCRQGIVREVSSFINHQSTTYFCFVAYHSNLTLPFSLIHISGVENVDVTLIDALPDPTGRTPYLSSTGKPVEAGTRGFWKDYPNINALVAQLGLNENDVFTPFTNSSFYSPDGLEATAPVFGDATLDSILGGFPIVGDALKNTLLADGSGSKEFPMLPSPLGQVLATIPYFERLPIADRASMVGLLIATIDW